MNIDSINENNQTDIRQFGHIPIISPAIPNMQEDSDLPDLSSQFKKIQPPMNFIQLLRIDEMVKRFKDKLISRAYIFSQKQEYIISKCYEEKYLQFKQQEQQEFSNQVFDPSSRFFIIFDIAKTLNSFILLWLLPYLWSFRVLGDLDLDEVCLFSILFFLIEIVMKLNIAIIEKGNIIYSRTKILQYYTKNYLPQDAILIFGLLVLMYLEQAGTILILPVTIIIGFKFQECLDYLNEAINFNLFWREIINLFRLLIQINFFTHVIACVWYFIGNNIQQSQFQSSLSLKNIKIICLGQLKSLFKSLFSPIDRAKYFKKIDLKGDFSIKFVLQEQVLPFQKSIHLFMLLFNFDYRQFQELQINLKKIKILDYIHMRLEQYLKLFFVQKSKIYLIDLRFEQVLILLLLLRKQLGIFSFLKFVSRVIKLFSSSTYTYTSVSLFLISKSRKMVSLVYSLILILINIVFLKSYLDPKLAKKKNQLKNPY